MAVIALSSREDYLVNQFSDMRDVNRLARRLYDVYYIDIDYSRELSPMDRMIMPNYWVDPQNPEHPVAYILAGKSSLSFVERITYIYPYVEKKKFRYDLSAYRGSIINSQEMFDITKPYRKSKLDPFVEDKKDQKIIILKEDDDGIQIPILSVTHPEDIYNLIYQKFYRYLPNYLQNQKIHYTKVESSAIEDLMDCRRVPIYTEEGDRVDLTKELFPNIKKDMELYIGRVPNPNIDQMSDKWHYILIDQFLTKENIPYVVTYTLIAAIQM